MLDSGQLSEGNFVDAAPNHIAKTAQAGGTVYTSITYVPKYPEYQQYIGSSGFLAGLYGQLGSMMLEVPTNPVTTTGVSAGDVLGGSPLLNIAFKTYDFQGTRPFLIGTQLNPVGLFDDDSSAAFTLVCRKTTNASAFDSASATDYVFTMSSRVKEGEAVQNISLSQFAQLEGNSTYQVWLFGTMNQVDNDAAFGRGITNTSITVEGLNA